MKSELHVSKESRDYFKSELKPFIDIAKEKIFPIFCNIHEEADETTKDYYESTPWPFETDDSSLWERAVEKGFRRYVYLKLAKYEIISISIASLYLMLEQQLRDFLYSEMKRIAEINFSKFCTTVKEIKEVFQFHNLDITKLKCWSKIKELELLCHVIKHGDGRSARKLFRLKPSLFKKNLSKDYESERLTSTLLQETLNTNEQLFKEYGQAILDFWDEIPESSISDEIKPGQRIP